MGEQSDGEISPSRELRARDAEPLDIGRRRAFVELEARDAELLRELHERLGAERCAFVDELYAHLLAFEETRRFLRDEAVLERLKAAQLDYFDRLTAGPYDDAYAARCLAVGEVHRRIGLDPQWYLGGYRKYLDWLLPAVRRVCPDDEGRATEMARALMKVVFFDVGLAIDAYIAADRRALLASEASLRAVIEGSPDAITVERDGRLAYVNDGVVRLLGYEAASELVGRDVGAIECGRGRAHLADAAPEPRVEGATGLGRQTRYLRRDGETVPVEVVSFAIVFDGVEARVAVARDASQRHELTAKMMAMDRVISVGMLAASVGHEINNPLTYVGANLDLALERLDALAAGSPLLDDAREALRHAREGAARIRGVIRDLATYTLPDREERVPVALDEVIRSALDIASHEIRHRARLVVDLTAVPPVLGSAGRLGQVFVNLLVNAAHAIEEGAASRNEIRVRLHRRGDEVLAEVSDTGQGVRREDAERLFDAFFTTKSSQQGTGLGLTICKSIVDGHGGRIDLSASELGRGTTFSVCLPVAPPEAAARTRSAHPAPTMRRRGRVLVIDDEPLVARVVQRALEPQHRVEVVSCGRAALALLESGRRFDLVLCDVMMGEMTGATLYEAVAALDPGQASRMVFMTGGAFTPSARAFLERVRAERLDKPFGVGELRALVDRALDPAGDGPEG